MTSEGVIIGGKYSLLECIGHGAFGELFYGNLFLILAKDIKSNHEVAVKLEFIQRRRSLLKCEVAIYKMFKGEVGFPKFYWSGIEGEYNAMVIELLGPSLENLMKGCHNKFSVSTTFALAEQMVIFTEKVVGTD